MESSVIKSGLLDWMRKNEQYIQTFRNYSLWLHRNGKPGGCSRPVLGKIEPINVIVGGLPWGHTVRGWAILAV